MKKNIPNILSVIRIILVFVFVFVFFALDNPIVAILIFLLAGATDILDGYLARRNNWITNLGKILDPLADKLMQCTVLICLLIKNYIPWWFVLPFFIKEVTTLVIGSIVIRRRSVVVVSKWYGKASVCLFYATIVIAVILRLTCGDLFANYSNIWLEILVFAPAAIFATIAFIAYIKHYSTLKKEDVSRSKIRDVIK